MAQANIPDRVQRRTSPEVVSRPGHGIPLDEMVGDPFVEGLVAWTKSKVAELHAGRDL